MVSCISLTRQIWFLSLLIREPFFLKPDQFFRSIIPPAYLIFSPSTVLLNKLPTSSLHLTNTPKSASGHKNEEKWHMTLLQVRYRVSSNYTRFESCVDSENSYSTDTTRETLVLACIWTYDMKSWFQNSWTCDLGSWFQLPISPKKTWFGFHIMISIF